MPTCETCKHWDHYVDTLTGKHPGFWGICTCELIKNGDPPSRRDAASFWAGGDREFHLLTGPAFGCVHHQPR